MRTQSIQIEDIRRDGGTQVRAELDAATVQKYRELAEDGSNPPPVKLMYDGSSYWLWDGFHRVEAAEEAGFKTVEAEVSQGTQRDAIYKSLTANKANGLPLNNGDMKRAVERMLRDEEWSKYPQTKIASDIGCSQQLVSQIKAHLTSTSKIPSDTPAKSVTRNGKTYEMNTSKIGRKPSKDCSAQNTTRESEKTIVNTDTGEVMDNAAVVTVTTKTEKPETHKRESKFAAYPEIERRFTELKSLTNKPDYQLSGISIRDAVDALEAAVAAEL
jgi:hypothetical protein